MGNPGGKRKSGNHSVGESPDAASALDAAKAISRLPKAKHPKQVVLTATESPRSKPAASGSGGFDNQSTTGQTAAMYEKYADLKFEHMATSLELITSNRLNDHKIEVQNMVSSYNDKIRIWAYGTILAVVAILAAYHFTVIQSIKKDVLDSVELFMIKYTSKMEKAKKT